MRVTFPSGTLQLEGDLETPAVCARAAVICHPHPQYGGDMDNTVVVRVTAVLGQAGFATLRFNFRGVGGSTGVYAGGAGERTDACAAVRYLVARTELARVTLAGYSFGAMIALQAGAELAAVDQLIAIAPPLTFFDLGSVAPCTKPKLFVVGDRDQYCSVAALGHQMAALADPKRQHVIAGADHFFFGHEQALAEAVRAFACSR